MPQVPASDEEDPSSIEGIDLSISRCRSYCSLGHAAYSAVHTDES